MQSTGFIDVAAKLRQNNVKLVAVSKTQPLDAISALYNQGQRVFGENRVQELVEKYETLPKDIEWHLIGHLQTNKVKYAAPFVAMIHSIDSIKLLEEVNKQAARNNRVIDCLLQIFIASEETKFGLIEAEMNELLESKAYSALKNIRIRGLMGMASFTDNAQQIHTEFNGLNQLFQKAKATYFANTDAFDTLSMGMSSDYEIAIAERSNMVRIGSLLFGKRQ